MENGKWKTANGKLKDRFVSLKKRLSGLFARFTKPENIG